MKPKASQKPVLKKIPLFARSLSLAKPNPGKIGLMVLFDFMFFFVFFFVLPELNDWLKMYIAKNISLSQNVSFYFILIFLLLGLIYYLMVLLIYSFFKYCVLDSVKSLFEAAQFSFKRLWQFYSLNIVIAGIFFAVFAFIDFLLMRIKEDYRIPVFVIFAAPIILFLYIILNTSHSSFYEGSSIKASLKKGFESAFTKIKAYKEAVAVLLVAGSLLWLVLAAIGYLIRIPASKNYGLYANAYAYFTQSSLVIFYVVFYFIILINRISFYAMAREDK